VSHAVAPFRRNGLQFPWSPPAATGDAQFARVYRAGWSQLARIQMKCINTDHSRIEILVRLQKFPQRLRGDFAATGDSNVRMPGTKLRLDASGERRFLHALVDLEQMRVRLADADPDNFWRSFCGKCSDTNNRQKERAKLNCAEFFVQRKTDIVRHITEETERQVHLSRVDPAHPANLRIKAC